MKTIKILCYVSLLIGLVLISDEVRSQVGYMDVEVTSRTFGTGKAFEPFQEDMYFITSVSTAKLAGGLKSIQLVPAFPTNHPSYPFAECICRNLRSPSFNVAKARRSSDKWLTYFHTYFGVHYYRMITTECRRNSQIIFPDNNGNENPNRKSSAWNLRAKGVLNGLGVAGIPPKYEPTIDPNRWFYDDGEMFWTNVKFRIWVNDINRTMAGNPLGQPSPINDFRVN